MVKLSCRYRKMYMTRNIAELLDTTTVPAKTRNKRVHRQTREKSSKSSDIKKPDVFGIALDEAATGFDVLTHQDCKDLVSGGGVVERDLQ